MWEKGKPLVPFLTGPLGPAPAAYQIPVCFPPLNITHLRWQNRGQCQVRALGSTLNLHQTRHSHFTAGQTEVPVTKQCARSVQRLARKP